MRNQLTGHGFHSLEKFIWMNVAGLGQKYQHYPDENCDKVMEKVSIFVLDGPHIRPESFWHVVFYNLKSLG